MRILRFLTTGLAALLLTPIPVDKGGVPEYDDTSGERSLRCVICLDKSSDYLTGYNYELLKAYGESLGGPVSILLGEEGVSYSDSLILDSLDVVVMAASALEGAEGTVPVSLGDTSFVWGMRDGDVMGAVRWFAHFKGTDRFKSMNDRFFNRGPAAISPYDDLFRKSAGIVGWDWRLLAALAWSESRFRIQARSPRGALGIMQMMPVTADRFGVTDALDPEQNITAGARYLAFLKNMLRSYTDDPDALAWLTIAAYNSGGGRALQDLEGRERSSVTAAYIEATLNRYDIYRGLPPRYQEIEEVVEEEAIEP